MAVGGPARAVKRVLRTRLLCRHACKQFALCTTSWTSSGPCSWVPGVRSSRAACVLAGPALLQASPGSGHEASTSHRSRTTSQMLHCSPLRAVIDSKADPLPTILFTRGVLCTHPAASHTPDTPLTFLAPLFRKPSPGATSPALNQGVWGPSQQEGSSQPRSACALCARLCDLSQAGGGGGKRGASGIGTITRFLLPSPSTCGA